MYASKYYIALPHRREVKGRVEDDGLVPAEHASEPGDLKVTVQLLSSDPGKLHAVATVVPPPEYQCMKNVFSII